MRRQVSLGEQLFACTLTGLPDERRLRIDDGAALGVALQHLGGCDYRLTLDGDAHELQMICHGDTAFVHAFGRHFTLRVNDPVAYAAAQRRGHADIARAPMPGIVLEAHARVGDAVHKGQTLLSIESMKIMSFITAWRDGRVSAIGFQTGQAFAKGATLLELAPEEEAP